MLLSHNCTQNWCRHIHSMNITITYRCHNTFSTHTLKAVRCVFLHLKYRVWEPRFLSMASREPMPRYFFSRMPSEKKYSPGASLVAASREPIITEIRVSQGGELEAGLEWITRPNRKYSCDYPNLWMLPVPELWRCGRQSGCRRQRWRARRTSWRTPIPCRPLWPGVGRTPALVGARRGFRERLTNKNIYSWKRLPS